jgi:tetratricopeptide (TPR) repeat protein
LGCYLEKASIKARTLPHTQPYLAKRIPANATALDVFQYALPKDQEMAAFLQDAKARANLGAQDFADNGAYFFGAKDYATAMIELNKSLAADPRNAQALFLRGECKRQLSLLEEAERDYSEAIRISATKEAHMARGRTRYDLGRTGQAVADFDYVLKINDKQMEALYWRGKCHIRNGNNAAACDDLRTSAGLGFEAAVVAVKLYCQN